MEDVDREISEMKLSLNARARIVAESYLAAVSLSSAHSLVLALMRCFPSLRKGSKGEVVTHSDKIIATS